MKSKASSTIGAAHKSGQRSGTSRNLAGDEQFKDSSKPGTSRLVDANGDDRVAGMQHRRNPPNRTPLDSSDIDDDWEVPAQRSIKKRKVAPPPPPDEDDSDVIVLSS